MVQVQLKHHVRPWRKPPRSWASVTRFYRSILENRRPHDANALVMLHEPAPGEHGAGSQGQTSFVSGGFAAVTTRGPAAGSADEKTAGLRRQAGAQLTNSLVRVARPALVTPFAGLAGVLGVRHHTPLSTRLPHGRHIVGRRRRRNKPLRGDADESEPTLPRARPRRWRSKRPLPTSRNGQQRWQARRWR